MKAHLVVVCIVVCTHIRGCLAALEGDLSAYEIATFVNPDPGPGFDPSTDREAQFNHFALGPDGVYVGGINWLYRLDRSNLNEIQNVTTCIEDPLMPCRRTNNYNKILVVDQTNGRLITCGSEYNAACQLRDLNNISDIVGEDPIQNVAAPGMATTVSLIAPGRLVAGSDDMLYIAAEYVVETFRSITSRNLNTLIVDHTLLFAINYRSTPFPITYVAGFNYKGFTYFVASQNEDIGSDQIVSKINRVCQNATNFDAYTEIVIQCGESSNSLVQSAHVGPAGADLATSLSLAADDQVLYAVFAENQGGTNNSALCVYNMKVIEDGFKAAAQGCFEEGEAYRVNYLQDSVCSGTGSIDVSAFLCTAISGVTQVFTHAKGIDPISSSALLQLQDTFMSSIITNVEEQHTIALIGTSTGDLLKVHVTSASSARLYENITLDSSPVLTDVQINSSSQEMLVLTKQKLIKMRLENCGQYTTCESCIGPEAETDGDPFCGWCTLDKKCTRKSECYLPDASTRWLQYNNTQCIMISDVKPNNSIPIVQTEQEITLTVEQLPDLSMGNNYSCVFGIYESLATTNGNELKCISPPGDQIPPIQEGDDAATVVLSVFSTETNTSFVDIDFHFYECSRHEACVPCVASDWSCYWCIFESKCTNDSYTCTTPNEIIITGANNPSNSMPKGIGYCPQLANQTMVTLLPNGIQKSISVETENLPDSSLIMSYTCLVKIDGVDVSTSGNRVDDNITCGAKEYTYLGETENEMSFPLRVEWVDTSSKVHLLNDLYDFEVTIYKCEVQRPDCSRCVAEARPELQCTWCCEKCLYDDLCDRECVSANRITLMSGSNCPDPVLTMRYPTTGPIEGGTILAVTGTDLGRTFEDIIRVVVGDQPCDLEGLKDEYLIGSSVSCRTPSKPVGSFGITLTVLGGDDTTKQNSSGDIAFQYRDPKLMSFQPIRGPADGGTAITVHGSNLDTGRTAEGFIGSYSCIVLPVQDTELICVTTSGSVSYSGVLTVSFDGANRTLPEQMFTYVDNPVVTSVEPLSSIASGGRDLILTGQYLDIIQDARIVVNIEGETFEEVCNALSSTSMVCKSPSVSSFEGSLQASQNVMFGFILDGVRSLLSWSQDNDVSLEYVLDPEYEIFNSTFMMDGPVLTLKGKRLDSAITAGEVIVWISTSTCTVSLIDDDTLQCRLPGKAPPAGDFMGRDTCEGLPVIWVIHSNLQFRIGCIQYPGVSVVIIIVACFCSALLVIVLFPVLCLSARWYGSKKEVKRIRQDMLILEQELAVEIHQAFVELQTDLTDLTSDLAGIGMPFVSHRDYAMNMLFIGQKCTPNTADEEYPDEHVEQAMSKFSHLLSNKNFLLVLIQTLDAESSSKLPIRKKHGIASLLTVNMILENKLTYLTDIIVSLMTQWIETAVDNERTHSLFNRTETILEKLLSNWVALCLYDQLKTHTAYPLFVLYRAIKYRSESGPIDFYTGHSRYSLSFDQLLFEDVEFTPLTLQVLVDNEVGAIKEVKVLDVDTISQVKEKILDAIYLNRPYSNRPCCNQVDLEWHQGRSGHLVLTDEDIRPTMDKWHRLNMLKDFQVPDHAQVMLVRKQEVASTMDQSQVMLSFQEESNNRNAYVNRGATCNNEEQGGTNMETDPENGRKWHLVQEEESTPSDERSKCGVGCNLLEAVSFRHKVKRRRINEIALPRLLATKGILEEYTNNMFKTILSVESAPKAIKYLFDFFDRMAIRFDLLPNDPEITHIWKRNILPLRFWSNAIKHPDYIFDIKPSRPVEGSLEVIGQLFHDSHDAKAYKLGKEASISKLLYTQERIKYQGLVDSYFRGVEDSPAVSTQELNKELFKTCENFNGLFSKLSSLKQLWDNISSYHSKMQEALSENEKCEEEHLAFVLDEIKDILQGVEKEAAL